MKRTQWIILSTFLCGIVISLSVAVPSGTACFPEIVNDQIGFFHPTDDNHPAFEELVIIGSHGYVSDADLKGLRLISLAVPTSPYETGHAHVNGTPYALDVSNNIAFLRVNASNGVIECIDVSSPVSPHPTGHFPEGLICNDFDVEGNYLYLANGTSVVVLNIANPNLMIIEDSIDIGGSVQSIQYFGGYLYISNWSTQKWIQIIDASTPSNLNLLGSIDVGNYYPSDFAVVGHILYTSGRNYSISAPDGGTVQSFNITDKMHPLAMDSIVTGGISTSGIAISGNTLYTGACKMGLVLINITSPTDLQPIGHYIAYQTQYCGGEYYAQYPHLYSPTGYHNLVVFLSINCGLHIVDVNNPEFKINTTPTTTDNGLPIGINNWYILPIIAITAGILVIRYRRRA
jgi:hypothetical protein